MSNRKYDKQFKIDAIDFYHNNGKSLDKVSKDLGVPKSTLCTWIKNSKYREKEECFPGSGRRYKEDEEIFQLKKELAILQEERDILKKAVAIFSIPKGKR